MGVSRRAYAALRGVSEAAVRKALATGRIAAEPDGTIDPVRADLMWDAATDPAKQRGVHARHLGRDTAAALRIAAGTKPVPRLAFAAVAETLSEAGADLGGAGAGSAGAEGGEVSFVKARMANEVLKAQTARVRLQKMKGEVVDRARATAMVFDLARRERDAWLNWPPRVAADIAAELGAEPHAVEQVLMRYLRRHLTEMSEVKVELR
jgi:hypothetical protein